MNNEKTYNQFTQSGNAIADMIISALAQNNISARKAITYRDYGQNWEWDTILVETRTGAYQALNPRQFESMNDGTFDYSEINSIIQSAKNLTK